MSVTAITAIAAPEAVEETREPATGARELAAAVAAVLADADRVLGAAHRLAGDPADQAHAAAQLDRIADGIAAQMLGGVRSIRMRESAALLARVYEARAELERVRSYREAERRRTIGTALRGLRGAATVEQMLRLIPAELCRCGFARAWLSVVDGSQWRPVALHGTGERAGERRGDPPADGPAHPLLRGSHEAEAVRRRRSVLVADAAADEAVDPYVTDRFAPSSYVAAPLLVDTRVVALVHADRPRSAATLDEHDRDLIGVFAEGASYALQRAILGERLEQLRLDVRTMTHAVGDLVDDRCFEPIAVPRREPLGPTERQAGAPAGARAPVANRPRTAPTAPSGTGSRLAGLLTSRELEVLRLMASGETNAGIAQQLVISQGTVKSHVKSVLRKLHAANRAQAVSQYFRLVRTDGAV